MKQRDKSLHPRVSLLPRQRRFAILYAGGGLSGLEAAVRAGYSKNRAANAAYRLLEANKAVRELIKAIWIVSRILPEGEYPFWMDGIIRAIEDPDTKVRDKAPAFGILSSYTDRQRRDLPIPDERWIDVQPVGQLTAGEDA